MGQKGKGICEGMKYAFHKHVALIGICIGILILLSADIGVVSASPSITSWSSTEGLPVNKDNPHDLMYLVQQGDTTTFSVNASESVTYNWYVNKIEQENNQNIFAWTVPNKKGIWEIHLKVSNANGEDHIEWAISTLNEDEAPDIFDYFTDKKYSSRAETDLWGRALPEWNIDTGSFDVSNAYLSADTANDLITLPTTIAYGTWKFKYQFPNAGVDPWVGMSLRFMPLYVYPNNYRVDKGMDGHDHTLVVDYGANGSFSMDYDAGCHVNNQWLDMTVIRTNDGWFYIYRDDLLVFYCQDDRITTNTMMLMGIYNIPLYIDQFEVYENKYLFPGKEIVFAEYVANYISPSVYPEPVKKEGIVVMGGTTSDPVTLSDINNAINNLSRFTYNPDTKTAICYTDLVVFDGASLNIENETLKFHCDCDGELYFAPKYASYLRIKNSTITTDTDHYFIWNNAGSTTHFGGSSVLYSEFGTYYSCIPGYGCSRFNPVGTMYTFPSISWSCYARFIIEDSVINNTAHIFFDSPKDLTITNTVISNLHECDIGNYAGTWGKTNPALQRQYLEGEKSFWVVLDEMSVHEFDLSGITFSGASNLTFMVNSLRDRINIYDIDAGNANITVRKPLAQNAVQSHTWAPYTPQGETYIDSELGLVNCKFKNLLITTDKAWGVPKYYLDVKVIDVNGDHVSGATVNVTNEVDATYSAENVKAERIYATGDWDNLYHHYRFLIGQPLTSTITGSDGHTPLPSDKANTFVISDYVKDQTSQTNFTYSITTSKDGKTASLPNWDIDESWYREDQDTPTKTVVCNIDTGECRVESVATGANSPTTNATITPTQNETGWNNVTPVVVTSFRSDNDSGISHTNYSKTSETGPWTTVTTSAATGPDAGNVTEISEGGFNVKVSDEGTTEIWFYSVDIDSNVEPLKNITVKIDTTPHIKNVIIQSPNDVTDNRLRENSPDAVLGSTTFIDVGRIGSTGNYRDVIWFNLSQLNSTDLIESAKLSLFWYYESRDMSTMVEIYRPVEWAETYVNWNNRTNGVAWIYPGGDWYDTNNVAQGNTPYASLTFPVGTPDNAYHEFDVTELVQSYVNGRYENTGFFIKANEVSDGYIAFRSSDWANASERPKLVVSYGSGDVQQNSLSGTVTSPSGTDIPNATVTLTTRAGAEINTTQTDSTGHYAFANVSPDYYDITATKRSYWSNTNNVTVTTEAPETADIVLSQKGDFNTNSEPADAGDLAMMADATEAGTSDVTYDLDGDGNPADEADLTLLKDVSVGVAELE